MPFELVAASEKGAGFRMLGDVLGGIGGIATAGGLSVKGLFGFGADPKTMFPKAPTPPTGSKDVLRLTGLF